MPNSITIVSPVSGETIASSAVMNVSVDYEYVYVSDKYVGANCSTSGGHSGHAGPIGGTPDSAEVGLSSHSGATYTGVEVTARIQETTSWGSGYVAQSSVNNITIMDNPPIVILPLPIHVPLPITPYFRVGKETAKEPGVKLRWQLDFVQAINKNGVGADEVKLDREYDEKTPPELKGTVKKEEKYLKGKIIGAVYGKKGTTGLVLVYTLKDTDVTLDAVNGNWEVILPEAALKASQPPRQIILTFFDKDGAFAATVSAPLRKKA